MKLLAIETTTQACSAALLIEQQICSRFVVAPRQHAQLILPMVNELLQEAGISLSDLSAIAFTRGPGSFTGIRIGSSVVQGLAFAAELPVVPISSLQALAYAAYCKTQAHHVLAALDARMQEVYWGQYQCSEAGIVLQGDECVVKPEHVPIPPVGDYVAVGSGFAEYGDALQQRLSALTFLMMDPSVSPHAEAVVSLAQGAYQAGAVVSPEQALPLYLRDNVTD